MKEQIIREALRRAYNLGQIYWQQADGEYPSQWKKAYETRAKFRNLVEETCAAIEAASESNPAIDAIANATGEQE